MYHQQHTEIVAYRTICRSCVLQATRHTQRQDIQPRRMYWLEFVVLRDISLVDVRFQWTGVYPLDEMTVPKYLDDVLVLCNSVLRNIV